jgi:PAS domain S-box-containing protein
MKKDTSFVLERTQRDLQKCQEQLTTLQTLLNSSLDVVCSIDRDGRFVHVSAAATNVWGYEPQELVGKSYMELVVPQDRLKTIAAADSIMSGVDVTSFENNYAKKDGAVVPMLWSARWSESEQIMYCVAKDATTIRKAKQQKDLLDRRLSRAYKLANIAWWEYDIASQTYTSSDEIFEMYGLPVPENNQNSLEEFLSLVHPDDRLRLQNDLASTCQDTYINYEHRIVKPSGEVIYVIHYSEMIRNKEGHPVALHGTTKDITIRKLYQLRLEESEKRLQHYSHRLSTILESIGDGFFAVDQDWTVTYWNRKAEELLGRKREDMIGKNLWQVYKDVISPTFFAESHRAVDENQAAQFEEYFTPANRWIEVAAYPSGEGLSVYLKDISERKWQEKALHLANERFELAAMATSDALWDWDVLNDTCYFNEGFTSLFGHTNITDFIYNNWMDNIHASEKEMVLASLSHALQDTGVSQWQHEYRFRRQNGSIAHVLDRGFINRDEEGKAVRMVGSMQDITKLKEAETEMKKLSIVAKETPNVVIITDPEDRITWVNKAFTDITEFSFEEALGKNPGKLLQGPRTSQRTKRYLHRCVEKKQPFHCEIINYSKSGREYWMEIKGQPLFDESGKLQQFFAIQTDITARKEADALIRLSEEKYRLLFYSSPRPMWTFHADSFQIVDVNKAALDLYGYSREEFLALTVPDLKPPHETPELIASVQSLKNRKINHFEKVVQLRKKNGETFYFELTSFALQLSTGLHLMVSGTDMTEKLQLQQKVIAEKILAQKQIARAIIHAQETERSEIGKELHDNVCQLLTTAKLYIENIRHMPEQQEAFTKKGLDLLVKSINEIRYLSRQLVSPVSAAMDFEASVTELINHYQAMNLFEIRFDYKANIEQADKDLKTSIVRILQEQFNNTVKYAKASVVSVGISNSDDVLKLQYSDNGIGFDPGTAKKGIGLANIKHRAGAYRGIVNLQTGIGQGCRMEIIFPLKEQSDAVCFA